MDRLGQRPAIKLSRKQPTFSPNPDPRTLYLSIKYVNEYKNLWDQVSEMITRLGKEDEVDYRVKATPESVDAKLNKMLVNFVLI